MENLETLKRWVSESRRMVALTGAGVSTESGIQDFRGVDGLYHEKFQYPPETIISHSFYLENPEYFFRFYWALNPILPTKPWPVGKQRASSALW